MDADRERELNRLSRVDLLRIIAKGETEGVEITDELADYFRELFASRREREDRELTRIKSLLKEYEAEVNHGEEMLRWKL